MGNKWQVSLGMAGAMAALLGMSPVPHGERSLAAANQPEAKPAPQQTFANSSPYLPTSAFGLYPLIRNYSPGPGQGDPKANFATVTDTNGFLLVGGSEGVFRFDGYRWKQLVDEGKLTDVYSLATDRDGTIYYGAHEGFGKLVPEANGNYHIQSLVPNKQHLKLTISLVHREDGKVYFYSSELLYVYDKASGHVVTLSPKTEEFSGMLWLNHKVFVNEPGEGLSEVQTGVKVPAVNGKLLAGLDIRFAVQATQYTALLGTIDGQSNQAHIYRFDGNKLIPFAPALQNYLDNRGIDKAELLPNGLLAVATEGDGCYLIDVKSEAMAAVLDVNSGLPSENIFSLCATADGGLWLSHNLGFSYVGCSLPVQDLSHAGGLKGNVQAIQVYQGRVYVGTDSLLYYLNLDELIGAGVVKQVERVAEPLPQKLPPHTNLDNAILKRLGQARNETHLKKLAKRYLRDHKRPKPIPPLPLQSVQSISEIVYRTLLAGTANFRFRPVTGIGPHCNSLAIFQGQLLASTLNGLFQVTNTSAVRIGKKAQYSGGIYRCSKFPDCVFVPEGKLGLTAYRLVGGQWQPGITVQDVVTDNTFSAAEAGGRLLCHTASGIALLSFTEGRINRPKITRYTEPEFNIRQRLEVVSLLGDAALITRKGIYRVNPEGALFVDPALLKYFHQDNHYYTGSGTECWVESGRTLRHFTKTATGLGEDTLYLRNLFHEPFTNLVLGDKNQLWVAEENSIYRLTNTSKLPNALQLCITEAKGGSDSLLTLNAPTILSYSPNQLSLSFAVAAFGNPEGVLFRSRLQGLAWGAWSNKTTLDYPDLKGDSKIEIQARDYLGRLSNTADYSVIVPIPFYRSIWAIVGYTLGVGLIIFGYARYRNWSLEQKQTELSRQVRERTKALEYANESLAERNSEIAQLAAERLEQNDTLKESYEKLEASKIEMERKNRELNENLATIHRQKELLQRSEKLADLGKLVANIAHEINNPLAVIKAEIQLLEQKLPSVMQRAPELISQLNEQEISLFFQLVEVASRQGEDLSTREERQLRNELIQWISERGLRRPDEVLQWLEQLSLRTDYSPYLSLLQHVQASEIFSVAIDLTRFRRGLIRIKLSEERAQVQTMNIKKYAQKSEAREPESLNLADNLDLVLTLYKSQIGLNIELVKHYETLPPIRGYPQSLQQVWTNLIKNAIQAMGGSGTLIITLKKETEETALVEITDNGPGIPKENLEKIFEEFYTTKIEGEGTGLGLAICREIITEKHKGTLTVSSEPGHTTFAIRLPFLFSSSESGPMSIPDSSPTPVHLN